MNKTKINNTTYIHTYVDIDDQRTLEVVCVCISGIKTNSFEFAIYTNKMLAVLFIAHRYNNTIIRAVIGILFV